MSSTYADKHAPKSVMAAFLAAALIVALAPFVGMLWARTDVTTENRELAEAPRLLTGDGSINVNFLADAGAYFNDHFAYRNEAVALNARLHSLFGTSSTDQVVLGSDGWLYYAGTLNDYLGLSVVSDRTLASIAHNLKLVQGYVESKGASFAFTIAPNKNTLFDEHMPEFYVRYPGMSNASRLERYLADAGVTYVDLFDAIASEGEVLYLKRDSHWDNRGALVAARALLGAFGRADALEDAFSPVERNDFVGDLEGMLHPGENATEPNFYYAGYHDVGEAASTVWSYIEGKDVTDSLVRTSGAGEGGSFVFRDSFGNALLPFLAGAFDRATFSKLVPYNIPATAQDKADCVIIERAERHVSDLATNPPIVVSPLLQFPHGSPDGAHEVEAMVEIVAEGSYWVISGSVDESLGADDHLYLKVQGHDAPAVYYDPLWMSFADESGLVVADNGFKAYIPASSFDAESVTLSVLAG